ncbi:MAG: FAD-binding oxidoreductase [Nitrospinota bacterium]
MDTDRFLSDLREVVGEPYVLAEPEELLAYECDALTIYRNLPLAVVLPDGTEEVQGVVRAAARHGACIVPRGAGTGLSGGALPHENGILIGFSRMNRILEVDLPNRRAVVQPGVVNLHLSQALGPEGYYYAPDPSSQMACTIGGNAAENSGGPHCLKYGVTTNHVLALELVLPDGERVELGGKVEDSPGLDLLGLSIGSEGTLGVITKITVRLLPLPEGVKTLLAVFNSMECACDAVSDIIADGLVPAALEMIDRHTIEVVEKTVRSGFPESAAAVLLIELDGPVAGMDEWVQTVEMTCRRNDATEFRVARSEEERARLWAGRKKAFGAFGQVSPNFYCLDGTVPRSRIAEAIRRIEAVGRKYGLPIANVFHAGDGNLHPLILFDDRIPGEAEKVVEAGSEILRACVELGGSLSGEHGIGVEKMMDVPAQFSEATLEAMKRVKAVFDPEGRCNPAKVFPTPGRCGELRGTAGRKLPAGVWI